MQLLSLKKSVFCNGTTPSTMPDSGKERPQAISLGPSQLEEDGRVNVNKWENDDGILQYSEIECNCAKKITEGLFREYSAL